MTKKGGTGGSSGSGSGSGTKGGNPSGAGRKTGSTTHGGVKSETTRIPNADNVPTNSGGPRSPSGSSDKK